MLTAISRRSLWGYLQNQDVQCEDISNKRTGGIALSPIPWRYMLDVSNTGTFSVGPSPIPGRSVWGHLRYQDVQRGAISNTMTLYVGCLQYRNVQCGAISYTRTFSVGSSPIPGLSMLGVSNSGTFGVASNTRASISSCMYTATWITS
jgi:hypothetical protein